jgi:hypothetical protein
VFDVIAVDAPWTAKNGQDGMTLAQLQAVPVWAIAARDAALFLWVPTSKKYDAAQLFGRWGFGYATTIYWDRPTPGAGRWFKPIVEEMLVCVRGRVEPFGCPRPNRIGVGPDRDGTGKPVEFFKLIEQATARMIPGRRVALFQEDAMEGWTTVPRAGIHRNLMAMARQRPIEGTHEQR